jgi:predicted N-acetyltransferase YhbS
MIIRNLTPGDIHEADEINRAAFELTESRAADLRRYLEVQPDGWFLALEEGKPVGVVGAIDYGAFAYIGKLGVLPQRQRQGIGRALMQHVIGWLEQRRVPALLLDASQKGYPLYTKLNFVEEDRACFYELTQAMADKPLSPRIAPLQAADLPELCAFDAPIFGANRETLLRIALRDFPGRAFVARDKLGDISGYVFRASRRLGPWVARTPQDAEDLMCAALTVPIPGVAATIVPEANKDAAEMLKGNGFELIFALSHMRRGSQSPPRQRALVYGQTSFGVG